MMLLPNVVSVNCWLIFLKVLINQDEDSSRKKKIHIKRRKKKLTQKSSKSKPKKKKNKTTYYIQSLYTSTYTNQTIYLIIFYLGWLDPIFLNVDVHFLFSFIYRFSHSLPLWTFFIIPHITKNECSFQIISNIHARTYTLFSLNNIQIKNVKKIFLFT